MADTYTQLYIQLVFGVKNREALIAPSWEDHLYRYITGILQQRRHKLLAINGMPDHLHIFYGMNPAEAISDLVREIKKSSTRFVEEHNYTNHSFRWQGGYGAFSYHKSKKQTIINYVNNQKEHHRQQSFKTEYLDLLQAFEVDYNDAYLFDFFDD